MTTPWNRSARGSASSRRCEPKRNSGASLTSSRAASLARASSACTGRRCPKPSIGSCASWRGAARARSRVWPHARRLLLCRRLATARLCDRRAVRARTSRHERLLDQGQAAAREAPPRAQISGRRARTRRAGVRSSAARLGGCDRCDGRSLGDAGNRAHAAALARRNRCRGVAGEVVRKRSRGSAERGRRAAWKSSSAGRREGQPNGVIYVQTDPGRSAEQLRL